MQDEAAAGQVAGACEAHRPPSDGRFDVGLGLRGRVLHAARPEDVRGTRAENGEHRRVGGGESDRGRDPVVLEDLENEKDAVAIGLEDDRVLPDQDAEQGLDRSLRAQERGQAALAGGPACDVVGEHPLQQLLPRGAGGFEQRAQWQVDDRHGLPGRGVLGRHVAVGRDHRLAAALAEAGAGRRVGLAQGENRRRRHRVSLTRHRPRSCRSEGQWDAMSLTPTPDNAARIAAMVVPFAEKNYGVTLDYGVESLSLVDEILDDLRRDQSFEDLQPLLFAMGCYVGQVMVRHAGAFWRVTEELGMGEVASSPIAIRVKDGRGCNPVGQVYKRFQNGPGESLESFYQVMAQGPSGEPAGPVGKKQA